MLETNKVKLKKLIVFKLHMVTKFIIGYLHSNHIRKTFPMHLKPGSLLSINDEYNLSITSDH